MLTANMTKLSSRAGINMKGSKYLINFRLRKRANISHNKAEKRHGDTT
jgi:hypothetical protein